MGTLFSICLYLFTFLFGFIADKPSIHKKKILFFYCSWIAIFFCFGYKTGSDWRAYELEFNSLSGFTRREGLSDFLFWDIFYLFKLVFSDFFLALGILKLFYLWSAVRLLKLLTPHWSIAISFLMPISLDFMLIDNPLRFMCAASFINLAMFFLVERKWLLAITFAFISVFFHVSSLIILLFLPLIVYNQFIYIGKKWLIILLYSVSCYVFSGVGPASWLMEFVGEKYLLLGAASGFTEYMVKDNSAVFTIGSAIQFFLLLFIVINRDVVADNEKGKTLYSIAILFYFMNRLLLIVPTGFRLALPFTFFTCAFFAELVSRKKLWRTFLTLYFIVFLVKDLYSTYTFIPYSNSIPHIVFGHEPYSERDNYNIKAYRERTGKQVDNQ